MRLQIMALAACLVVFNAPAFALSEFRDAWRQMYPDSNSDDIGGSSNQSENGCQLCHQNTIGGEPWNPYGWDVRGEYRTNGFDIAAALQTVEFENHDSDAIGANTLDEITWNFQPGWAIGNVNTLYMANGSTITNQPPPLTPSTTDIDFPAANTDPISDIVSGVIDIRLVDVAGGFNSPVQAVQAPGIDGSLFVVEQTGKIFRVELSTGNKTLFYDVSSDLVDINLGYDERGLLGLAFHPNYQSNGLFYTYQSEPARPSQDAMVDFSTVVPRFTPNHRSMVVEYRVSDSSCNSRVQKRKTMMIIDQPQSNHNGGTLVFGPDGYLYISLGDGGAANDQGPGHSLRGTGRDNTNVLGSILRVDPLSINSSNGKYGIPNDNPFIGNGDSGADEIFAFGFRNPYRMSFDAVSGELYVGDVGQNKVEEIDLVISGGNYGWNWQEQVH